MALSSHLQVKKSNARRFLQTAHRFFVFVGEAESGDIETDADIGDESNDDDEADDGTDIDESGSDAECRMDVPATGMGIGMDIGIDGVYPDGEDADGVEVETVGVVMIKGDDDGSDDDEDGDAVGDDIALSPDSPLFVDVFGCVAAAFLAHFEHIPFIPTLE